MLSARSMLRTSKSKWERRLAEMAVACLNVKPAPDEALSRHASAFGL